MATDVSLAPPGAAAREASSPGPAQGVRGPARTSPGDRRVYALSVALAVLTGALLLQLPGGGDTWGLALLLLLAFFFTESFPVHFGMRKNAVAATFSEVPLVVGLALCSPLLLVAARVLGMVAAMALVRRQHVNKIVFNSVHAALEMTLGVLVFEQLGAAGATGVLPVWGAALAVMLTLSLLSCVTLTMAISLHLGALELGAFGRGLPISVAAAAGNATVAVLMLAAYWHDAAAALPIVVLGAALLLAYRAYAGLRNRHRSMERLNHFTRSLYLGASGPQALERLLVEVRELVEAEYAEIVLPAAGGDERHALHADDTVTVDRVPGSWRSPSDAVAFRVVPRGSRRSAGEREQVEARGLRDCVVAVLPGVGGHVLVGNRLGDYSTFGDSDGKLLETAATHIGVALENARLINDVQLSMSAAERARDEAERSRDEAEEARTAAERASSAKSEFLSRMSHELRTPLNAILGFGQLLELGDLGEEDQENTEQIMKAGRHLLGLINEVLDVVRIESGRLSFSLEPVAIDEVLVESVGLVRPAALDRRIDIDCASTGIAVRADRQRLKQALVNLLSNAVKYNVDGGTVRVRAELVKSVTGGSPRVHLSVEDTGRGIAAEHLDDVFTPFERLGAEATEIEGTGIGLSLTRTLVEAMDGAIGLESEPGRGSTFWIELPYAGAGPAPDAPGTASGAAPVDGARTVLYVEDNPSNIRLVRRILERRPHLHLVVSVDGADGLATARTLEPDMVLLDLHLPTMHGADILAALRTDASERLASVPVAILTADVSAGNERRLLEAGATHFVPKPLDVQRLLDIVDKEVPAP
ncbi:ATP-binding protein [Motilibacter deserti]|uniref:histidine kinase n=1 Tax=Motilibacter deserti TaxID=2714956 RepID=A0ABX0H3C8_9ACTN|nr:ATP-binding protein [Motilibacter deserti]NHC15888.1 response regulator [Motilibacter deserti]